MAQKHTVDAKVVLHGYELFESKSLQPYRSGMCPIFSAPWKLSVKCVPIYKLKKIIFAAAQYLSKILVRVCLSSPNELHVTEQLI